MRQIVYREKSKGKPVFMEPTSVYFTIHHDGLQIHEENFVVYDEIINEKKNSNFLLSKNDGVLW